jgi:L-fuculose-phosphate aldolase
LPEAVILIGAVPLVKYGFPSTMEIPDAIREHVKNSDALLLENHGALTYGSDLLNAYYKMETLEHTACIIWNAVQLGNVNVLSEYERDRLLALRNNFGLQGRVIPCDPSTVSLNKESINKK